MSAPNPLVIGRIVHYVETTETTRATPVCRAAMVVSTAHTLPNLTVYPAETASPYLVRRVAQGERVRHWHWPADCTLSRPASVTA